MFFSVSMQFFIEYLTPNCLEKLFLMSSGLKYEDWMKYFSAIHFTWNVCMSYMYLLSSVMEDFFSVFFCLSCFLFSFPLKPTNFNLETTFLSTITVLYRTIIFRAIRKSNKTILSYQKNFFHLLSTRTVDCTAYQFLF